MLETFASMCSVKQRDKFISRSYQTTLCVNFYLPFFLQVVEFIREEMQPHDKVLIFVGRKVT